MDNFARRPADERRVFFAEAAARRDLTPLIVEKDFWVCWTLRRLMGTPELAGVLTFKGGTSLSKAFGIIKRFSEDIDLTINRSAPLLGDVASPMASEISGKERERRGKALSAAAQEWVATILQPTLAQAIEGALGTREGWSLEANPDDGDRQTILFNYPASSGYGLEYPKLERRYLELARIWSAAHPRRGRPRSLGERGLQLESSGRVRLRSAPRSA